MDDRWRVALVTLINERLAVGGANQLQDLSNAAVEMQDQYGVICDPALAPLIRVGMHVRTRTCEDVDYRKNRADYKPVQRASPACPAK